MLTKYDKAIAACVAALFSVLAVFGFAGDDGTVLGMSQDTAMGIITPIVTLIVTYIVPNKPAPKTA